MKRAIRITVRALLISLIGVFGVDYFSHLFFSSPMETMPYFFAKMAMYFIFSLIFFSFINLKKKEFLKILIGGIIVSSLWGFYYNVLPEIFEFYPFGIALKGLTFLGMGVIGTGIAFGTIHTLAFITGYYITKLIINKV